MGTGLKTVHEVYLPHMAVQHTADGKRMRESGRAKAGPDPFFHGSLKLPPDRGLSRLAGSFRKSAARLDGFEASLRVCRGRHVARKNAEKSIARLEARKEEAETRCRKIAEDLGKYEQTDVLLRLKPKDTTLRQVVGLIIGVGLVRAAEAVLIASSGYGGTIAVSAFVLTYLAWRAVLQRIIRASSKNKPGKDPATELFLRISTAFGAGGGAEG